MSSLMWRVGWLEEKDAVGRLEQDFLLQLRVCSCVTGLLPSETGSRSRGGTIGG